MHMRWERASEQSGSWFCLLPMCAPTSLYAKAEDAESRCLFFGSPSDVSDPLLQTPARSVSLSLHEV